VEEYLEVMNLEELLELVQEEMEMEIWVLEQVQEELQEA
jgi:hypothetical protein